MDNLSGLTAFVRAAEAKNFTEAGRQMNLSASAVTKAVSRLEERLAVRLFHRNTRNLSLTHEGSLLLASGRRIFAEIEAAYAELADTRAAPAGRLRVSLPMVGMLMMPTISQFMAAYPDIELDLDFTDQLVNVIEDGYDVVVRTGDGTDSRLIARRLGAYRLQLVGSPDYFARAGLPTTPGDLVHHACLHHRYPTSGRLQRWPLKPSSGGQDIELPFSAAATTIEPLLLLAINGNGIACIPDFATDEHVAAGRLMVILSEFTQHEGSFRAVWPSNRFVPPKVRVFADFLADKLLPRRGRSALPRSGLKGSRPDTQDSTSSSSAG